MPAHQKIALGLLIVVMQAKFGGWDALADPVGWVMVVLGVRELSSDAALRGFAWLALVASVLTYPPMLLDRMSDSTQWLLTLPQTVFEVLLCYTMARRVDIRHARRYKTVAWLLVLAAVGLLVRFGADVTALEVPVALTAVVANVWLIWMVFTLPKNGQNSQVT